MRIAPRTRLLSISRCVVALPVMMALAACTPDRELDLASPATGSQEQLDRSPAYASASVQTPVSSDARSKPARTARAAQPQREAVYYIEFRSRSAASYGHTFASVGKLDGADNIVTSEIVGLHPASESPIPWMIGHILPVPSETGASDGDTEAQYWTARYRVRMDKQRYDDLMTFIRSLQASSPTWHAVFYNCNAFIGDIARHMGLKAPDNTMLFPKEYIEELATRNGA
jgi:hypothetical protein